jgi:hypothetical protein
MDLLLLLVAAWNMIERPTNLELAGAWTMVLAAAEARHPATDDGRSMVWSLEWSRREIDRRRGHG